MCTIYPQLIYSLNFSAVSLSFVWTYLKKTIWVEIAIYWYTGAYIRVYCRGDSCRYFAGGLYCKIQSKKRKARVNKPKKRVKNPCYLRQWDVNAWGRSSGTVAILVICNSGRFRNNIVKLKFRVWRGGMYITEKWTFKSLCTLSREINS